jgi:hypothetical protein
MIRFRKDPPQEQVDELLARIGEWRQVRRGPGPMPGEIWEAAVALAREFGVCRVARALTIDYAALRRRTEADEEHGVVRPTFVQLPATQEPLPAAPHAPGTTLEISARDGSRMRICLESGCGTEAVNIVAAFLGSRG